MKQMTTEVNGKRFKWVLNNDGRFLVNDTPISVTIDKITGSELLLSFDGKLYHITLTKNNAGYIALVNGKTYQVSIENLKLRKFQSIVGQASSVQHPDEIRAPMPGLVVKREVGEGDNVKIGQGIVILEAMKMENEVKSPKTGVVQKVFVRDRQVVEKGEILALIL